MKKVLFFIPTLGGGGAEKVLVNLVNGLNRQKYSVTVMTLFDVGVNRKYLSNHVEYKSVFKRLFRGNTIFLKLFSPTFLSKKMITSEYDIVVSFLESPTTRIVATLGKSTKKVQWVHNEYYDKHEILKCYRSEKEFFRLQKMFDNTIHVAKTVQTGYRRLFPELRLNDEVLYNAIDTRKIRQLADETPEQLDVEREIIKLVSVGRLVPQKGFTRLVNVMAKLIKEFPDIYLEILGEGELRDKLEEQIKELGLESYVTLSGYHSNPYAYVKNADLFVCSSLHEGYSTAVTESLIVGTPVLTTNCSGMAELLGEQNEYGVIVDNSEDALYEGLRELLENPAKISHYSEMAKLRGKSFELSTNIKAVENMLDSL
ncbi:TPA: glycosyltransferase [Streptococcus suis]